MYVLSSCLKRSEDDLQEKTVGKASTFNTQRLRRKRATFAVECFIFFGMSPRPFKESSSATSLKTNPQLLNFSMPELVAQIPIKICCPPNKQILMTPRKRKIEIKSSLYSDRR